MAWPSWLPAAALTFATVSPTLATMIGLGVGIDYALFLISPHRQGLIDGADPVRAVGHAMLPHIDAEGEQARSPSGGRPAQ